MRSVMVLCLAVMGLLAVGCQNAMKEDNDKLWAENRELREKIKGLETRSPAPVAMEDARLKALQEQIAARDAEIARLKDGAGGTGAGTGGVVAPGGFEGMDTTFDPKAGTLTVNIAGDVLFDSGKAEVKETAKATLDRIAATLKKDFAGKSIRIEGHTDSDPIVKTKDTWLDNLDLSLERAAQVSRYLIHAGVDAKRVATVGFGEHRPKGADKKVNRRVEIVVVTR